jgi:integration host factor subunit alpha
MTLTKAELADLLFEKVGLNKREAKDMVEAFFEEIRNSLEGDGIKLSGFGNSVARQAAGHQSKTGRKFLSRRVASLPFMPAKS